MQTGDFVFDLPEELIAQRPPENRGHSRMMVIHRQSGEIQHARFSDFESFQKEGDLHVFNNTRVVPARYFSNDGKKEILRLGVVSPGLWRCLVKPGRKLREGQVIEIGDSRGTVVEIFPNGDRLISFDHEPDEKRFGHLALPPYIARPDDPSDQERYQTVYASREGAIAAPTAGLHFPAGMVERLPHAFVTLHVGLGTFRPVTAETVSDHRMHSETYEISAESARLINEAARVIAVGTTVVRVLESCARRGGLPLGEERGETDIFIYPPFDFKVTGGLLTNFHLPKSTLLMLVSAFASRELILEAYRRAVEERYRFFSYGDCMLLL